VAKWLIAYGCRLGWRVGSVDAGGVGLLDRVKYRQEGAVLGQMWGIPL